MPDRSQVIEKKGYGDKRGSAPKIQTTKFFPFTSSHSDCIFSLQRTIGNQAVQILFKSGSIQTKLKIGQPDNKYEQEADRVADDVMRMPEPEVQPQIEPEEEGREILQAKSLADQITPLVQGQVDMEEKADSSFR